MRVMAATARIGYIQAKLAITPAWGGGTDLCVLIGSSRALRMMACCEMIAADLALDWGLAEAVIHDGPDGADMQRFLKPLLERSGLIMHAIKRQTRAWRAGCSYSDRRAADEQDLVEPWAHVAIWREGAGRP